MQIYALLCIQWYWSTCLQIMIYSLQRRPKSAASKVYSIFSCAKECGLEKFAPHICADTCAIALAKQQFSNFSGMQPSFKMCSPLTNMLWQKKLCKSHSCFITAASDVPLNPETVFHILQCGKKVIWAYICLQLQVMEYKWCNKVNPLLQELKGVLLGLKHHSWIDSNLIPRLI